MSPAEGVDVLVTLADLETERARAEEAERQVGALLERLAKVAQLAHLLGMTQALRGNSLAREGFLEVQAMAEGDKKDHSP